jgi:hypothetical protein
MRMHQEMLKYLLGVPSDEAVWVRDHPFFDYAGKTSSNPRRTCWDKRFPIDS